MSWLHQPAAAQTVQQTETASNSSELQEVVVTAQKRSENQQDVPLAVQSMSADELAHANVTDATDLQKVNAGLQINTGTGVILPFLRGIGNPVDSVGNEASIAFYIDGFYQARIPNSYLEFNNIDRIEVLAGPQGTLFGRNASGGLVQIITKDPVLDPTVHAEIGYGNYDTLKASLYASTGIPGTDGKVAADIAAVFTNQGEGWGRNITDGNPVGYDDHKAARTKWLFKPWDDTQIRLTADYSFGKNDIGQPDNGEEGTTLGGITSQGVFTDKLLLPVGFYDSRSDFADYNRDEIWGVTGRIDHQFDWFDFSSLTGYQHSHGSSSFDGDFQASDYQYFLLNYKAQQWSQEFQLASKADSPVNWIVGLYYMNDLAGYDPWEIHGDGVQIPGFPHPDHLNLYGMQRIQSYAGYGQASVKVLEDSDITLGIRYTYDHLTAFGREDLAFNGGAVTLVPDTYPSKNFYKPTFKIAFDHHFTDAIMGYASYSRGFKDGTYNTLPLSAEPVNPEVLDAFELGAKTELFDHRLRFNGALFFNQLHDPQVQEIIQSVQVLVNAKGAEVKGAEFDAEAKLTDHLTARIGAEFLDGYFTSFQNAPFTATNPNPPYGNFPYTPFNASGNTLPRVPDATFNIGLDYRLPTEIGDFAFDVNYAFDSGYYWNPSLATQQKAYSLVDGQVRWYVPGDQWSIAIWGKNITGTKYYTKQAEEGNYAGDPSAPAPPATFGFTISYDFTAAQESPETAPVAPTPVTTAPPPPVAPTIEAARSFQVFFDFDKSDITAAAAKVIQAAADAVKAGHVVQITVTGHTDTVGSASYNQGLSERRAASVKQTLVADGVAGGEITTIGVGKTGLLVPTADGVREPQNRRAEIVLQ